MEQLGRWVIVKDVETENFGRHYAGQAGRIMQFSRDPDTGAMREYVVKIDDSGPEIPFKPWEIEIVGRRPL